MEKRQRHPYVPCQNWEIIQVHKDRWLDKETIVKTHTKYYLAITKKESCEVCYSMVGLRICWVKLARPTENDLSPMRGIQKCNSAKTNAQRQWKQRTWKLVFTKRHTTGQDCRRGQKEEDTNPEWREELNREEKVVPKGGKMLFMKPYWKHHCLYAHIHVYRYVIYVYEYVYVCILYKYIFDLLYSHICRYYTCGWDAKGDGGDIGGGKKTLMKIMLKYCTQSWITISWITVSWITQSVNNCNFKMTRFKKYYKHKKITFLRKQNPWYPPNTICSPLMVSFLVVLVLAWPLTSICRSPPVKYKSMTIGTLFVP